MQLTDSPPLEYLGIACAVLFYALALIFPLGLSFSRIIAPSCLAKDRWVIAPGLGVMTLAFTCAVANWLQISAMLLVLPLTCLTFGFEIARLVSRLRFESANSSIPCTHILARISQAFPSRAGQESVKYESAQFLSGDGVLKHIEVDNNEQNRCLPAMGSRIRNKLEKCGLGPSIVFFYYLWIMTYAGFPNLNFREMNYNYISPQALPADAMIPFNLSRYILEKISPASYQVVPEWSYLERGPLAGLAFAAISDTVGLVERQPWLSVSGENYFAYQAFLTLLNLLVLLPIWAWATRVTKTSPIIILSILLSAYPFVFNSYYSWPKLLSCYFLFSSALFCSSASCRMVAGLLGGCAILAHDSALFPVLALTIALIFAKSYRFSFFYALATLGTIFPWMAHKFSQTASSPRMLSFYLFCDDSKQATSLSLANQAQHYFAKHSIAEIASLHFMNLLYPIDPRPLYNLWLTSKNAPLRFLESLYPVIFQQTLYGLGIFFAPLIIWGTVQILLHKRHYNSGIVLLLAMSWGSLLPFALIAGCPNISITHTWGYPALLVNVFLIGIALERANFVKATIVGGAFAVNLFHVLVFLFYHPQSRPALHGSAVYLFSLSLIALIIFALCFLGLTYKSQSEATIDFYE